MKTHFDILIAIGIFVFSMIIMLVVRKKIGKDFEIKNSDILIGIIPLALWLLLSGKITSFEYGDLKIATAFASANNSPISEEISNIYRRDITQLEKSTIYKLDEILKSKPEALIFYSGHNVYDPYITEDYLYKLSESTLKYLLIKTTSMDFIGLITVDKFMAQAMVDKPIFSLREFVEWLNTDNIDKLKGIEGMLNTSVAVSPSSSKQEALARMQELDTKFLPVVENSEFKGIIEMEKLSTSLLMDISKAISK